MTDAHSAGPPGPKGGLSLGLDLRKNGPWVLLEMAQKYGDVVYTQIGRRRIFILNEASLVRQVLQDGHTKYKKSAGSRKVKDFLGEGLLTAEGEVWRSHRRLAQPAFHKDRIEALTHVVTSASHEALERWAPVADKGGVVDVHAEMMRLTLTIVARALFSTDVSQHLETMHRCFRIAFDHTVKRLHRLIDLPTSVPTPANLRFRAAVKELDEIVYGILKARRANGAGASSDLLGMLMTAKDEETGAALSDRELRDEVLTLLLGGYDTAANALSWTFCLLSKNPHARARLEQEIGSRGPDWRPGFSDIDALPYARMAFEESMRLYPPVWVLAREAAEDDMLGGYAVPKGAMILASPFVLHHDRRLWPNPEGFEPERFAGDKPREPRFAFYPFGGGPRLCMGARFAMMEAPLILMMAVARYKLELVPWHPAVFEPSITLSPRGGMPMFVTANTRSASSTRAHALHG